MNVPDWVANLATIVSTIIAIAAWVQSWLAKREVRKLSVRVIALGSQGGGGGSTGGAGGGGGGGFGGAGGSGGNVEFK